VCNCLNNWKTKFLTLVGKEILIKAMAQAIPTYCMSVFLLPNRFMQGDIRDDATILVRHRENTSKINWMSWEKMGTSKA
jgi:hypothetical protein